MKIGMGLYCHLLTADNFQFARQAGATHIVAHLIDYQSQFPKLLKASGEGYIWPRSKTGDRSLWTLEEIRDLKLAINAEGLELEAIENFDVTHWHDILLDGPKRKQQIEGLKRFIRDVGKAGIPIIGYDFSLAGVWGHHVGPFARGRAECVGFGGEGAPPETPIPNGQVWNLTYDPNAAPGHLASISSDELWQRCGSFLEELLPVAEEAGVRLAAHPDDPPMPTLRGTPRLVYQPHHYRRLLAISASPSNTLEFCMGTIQEMTEGSVYESIDEFTRQNRIAYIHFRNVRGKVPCYREVFLDEGDIDMLRVVQILHRNKYDGVLIPDHTPQMNCAAPWHAGTAYALGYIRAAIAATERLDKL